MVRFFMSTYSSSNPVTISTLNEMKVRGEKIACLTAYDATFSALESSCGIEVILVGDSLGMILQGHDSTLPVTMEDILYHLDSVKRANYGSMVMADMPFMSYASEEQTLENAAALMRAGANCVKLEGTSWISRSTELLSERGIPVCAHMGLTPQSVNRIGGYIVQGRNPDKAEELIKEAKLLEESGASMLLLECVPSELAKNITESVEIPVIGIGAGVEVDGQIMVNYDLLGITQMEKPPKFVKNYLQDASSIEEAIKKYVSEVKEKKFPGIEHSFK